MPSSNRRHFLLRQAPALAMTALCTRRAVADEVVKPVSEDEPAAKALGYVVNASKVDPKANPSYSAGQNCTSCSLFNRVPKTPFGKCEALSNRLVAEDGWCKAYMPAM